MLRNVVLRSEGCFYMIILFSYRALRRSIPCVGIRDKDLSYTYNVLKCAQCIVSITKMLEKMFLHYNTLNFVSEFRVKDFSYT